jgi:hypothetical protein
MPDQLRFFGFLFGFRYFHEHDTTLSILASLMYLVGVIAAHLIFDRPFTPRGTANPSNQSLEPTAGRCYVHI